MIYLDANFFILALLDPDKKGANARRLQSEIIAGKRIAVTCSLTLDEVMWVLYKNKQYHLIRRVVEGIYNMPNLAIKNVNALIPLRALDLIEKFMLKPRDAFHLAVMEELQLSTIVSDDSDFDKVAGIKRIKL